MVKINNRSYVKEFEIILKCSCKAQKIIYTKKSIFVLWKYVILTSIKYIKPISNCVYFNLGTVFLFVNQECRKLI